MNDISPLDLLHRALRFWWVVATCMALGGLIGFAFSSARSPLYEANAVYQVAFDKARAPDAKYLDIEAAKQAAMDIMFSTAVQKRVSDTLKAQGIEFPSSDFGNGRVTVQRMNNRWLLTVRSENAQDAAAIANAWAAAAIAPLDAAYSHAVKVEALEQQIASLKDCFAAGDLASGNACAGTAYNTRADLDAQVAELNSSLSAEQVASGGLVAALTLASSRPATLPSQPIYFGRNTLVLAGMFLGFLLGIGLTWVLPLRGKGSG
jgi:uncharacterized protein involved in exopolysaccharide biosynthesis